MQWQSYIRFARGSLPHPTRRSIPSKSHLLHNGATSIWDGVDNFIWHLSFYQYFCTSCNIHVSGKDNPYPLTLQQWLMASAAAQACVWMADANHQICCVVTPRSALFQSCTCRIFQPFSLCGIIKNPDICFDCYKKGNNSWKAFQRCQTSVIA